MIYTGDSLTVLRTLPSESVDVVITDPPYGLTSGRNGRSEKTVGAVMKGFMGLHWDRDVPTVDVWAELRRVAKPRANLLSFGGTRTFHRIACAIEDAGWDIHDTIMWVYGAGYPKTPFSLKPAWEPITVARNGGPRGLNASEERTPVDELRADIRADRGRSTGNVFAGGKDGSLHGSKNHGFTEEGRWPANVVHDGSDEVLAAFPDAPGQMADASSSSSSRKTQNVFGEMKRGNGRAHEPSGEMARSAASCLEKARTGATSFQMRPGRRHFDAGSAARFFYCARASAADRGEGNTHPTVKPQMLMRWLVRLASKPGDVILDPYAGSGSTGVAAVSEGRQFIGIERESAYVEMAERRIRNVAPLFAEARA